MRKTFENTATDAEARPVGTGAIVFYVLMIASWMFDFQSENAGESLFQSDGVGEGLRVQIYFLISYVVFFGLFILVDRRLVGGVRGRIPGIMSLAAATLSFLAVSATSGLLREQETYAVFRHVTTILIYLSAAYATARMTMDASPAILRWSLGALCTGFAVSTVLIILFFGKGIDVETVRYEIQGASSVAALGVLILMPILEVSALEVVAGFAAVTVIFLTITRTYLIEVATQALALLPMLSHRNIVGVVFRALAICGIIGGLFIIFGEQSLARWVERLFVSDKFNGEDPTLLSRYYEWEYMWDEFFSSFDKFLFGSGIAAETHWWIPEDLGGDSTASSSLGFGHNQHLSLLFTGGLIGGAPLLLVHFLQGWQGVLFLKRTARGVRKKDDNLFFLGAWGVVTILGYLAFNFLASCFGNRGFSLWYGIGVGLFLGARGRLANSNTEESTPT